jgi:hypothetical protein
MPFTTETLAGFLDYELVRALNRLREALKSLKADMEAIRAEQARRLSEKVGTVPTHKIKRK